MRIHSIFSPPPEVRDNTLLPSHSLDLDRSTRLLGDTSRFLQGLDNISISVQTTREPFLQTDARCPPMQWEEGHTTPLPVAAVSQVCSTHPDTPLPLAHFSHEWLRLPGVSPWVVRTITSGYTLQFCRNPPRFNGVLQTVVNSASQASVLRQELSSLLLKGAIEEIPPTDVEQGFFSRYFLVPKKGGGLRPILDLRRLNASLIRGRFKMLTLKSIIAQVRAGDWFISIDLKDAYFHVQVVQRHRKFLRFAFEGKVFQYKVLPFGLALAPRTFTKCVDAALAPLRLQGVRILNYLDDWLLLAHSRELASRHRDIVLSHIQSLGLRLNVDKSVLAPSQQTTFLGVCLDSVSMKARLAPARISSIDKCLTRFVLGHRVSVGTCRRLLGLMAAASQALPLGLLHMRPFHWWMKSMGIRPMGSPYRLMRVSRGCLRALLTWRDPLFLQKGVEMGIISCRQMITTDASLTGWGAVFEGRPAYGVWTGEALTWHINCLELRAVLLGLRHFLPYLRGHHVIVRTDNMAVVSHVNRQGGSRSRTLDGHARQLFLWAQGKFLSLRAVHVPGILNLAADFLSRQKLKSGEWRLNPLSVALIWERFGRADVDLFATEESSQCPLWFSLTPPAPLGLDAFAHPWPKTKLYAFPPVKLVPAVLSRVRQSQTSLLLVAPFWPSQ
ncbi:MAG: reverse transcriptase domain-containing protein, partial [Aeromonas sp.]